MSQIRKIIFPYGAKRIDTSLSPKDKLVVYFGTDFYNLPLGSNRELFINLTNQILDYIRYHFPGRRLIYQPHPNERDEAKHLKLESFIIGERTIAEIFLYEKAGQIEYTFSAQSGASISAFAMGISSVIFLDLLHGVLSEGAITAYRSYFSGLPDFCLMKSLKYSPPHQETYFSDQEKASLEKINQTINPDHPIWILVGGDPSAGLRSAILVKKWRQKWPKLEARLLVVNHRRWQLALDNKLIRESFDQIIKLPGQRIWYHTSLKVFLRAVRIARWLKRLPIKRNDNLVSLASFTFEENCLFSYHTYANKVLLIENRWYQFNYEGGVQELSSTDFHTPWGSRLFNWILEPILNLKRTIYREYEDGKVLNQFCYQEPLEKIFNFVFVLMPEKEII